MAGTDISVVIPSYNRRESLLRVVAALCEQDFAPERLEVVVVLDGSTDRSAEALDAITLPFDLRVIQQANRGAAAARNAGAAASSGTLLLFVDDDILLSPGALAAHVTEQRRIGGGCVLGLVVNEPVYRGLPAQLCAAWPPERLRVGRGLWTDLFTGNLSIPRAVFERVGGFDETLKRLEDMEFGFRSGLNGLRMEFSTEPAARQVFSKTTRQCLADRALDGASTAVLHRRDPRIIAMTMVRRPEKDGWLRALGLRCVASIRIPGVVSDVLGRIPERTPGSAFVFQALNAQAYLRGVRSEFRSWREWRTFFNRAGGWLPEDEREAVD